MAANHFRRPDMSAPSCWPPLTALGHPLHGDLSPYTIGTALSLATMPPYSSPAEAPADAASLGDQGPPRPTSHQPAGAPSGALSGADAGGPSDDRGRTQNNRCDHHRQRSLGPGPPADEAPTPVAQKPIRRRMRMITSCLECRRRKLKCEKKQPCHNCKRFQRDCVYLGPNLDEASQQRLTEIKEKVGSLERQLERDVAKGARANRNRNRNRSPDGDPSNNQSRRFMADDPEGEDQELQMTPLVALDLTYDNGSDGNGTDDLIDLGIRIGKMRITERIGGLNRPRISEEIQAGLAETQAHLNTGSLVVGSENLLDAPDLPDFLKPGGSYLPPSSGFFFGQFDQPPSFMYLLPPSALAHPLMRRYFEAVHPIARCVHRPSLEGAYASFWDDVRQNVEPRASIQTVVFAAWFSAAVTVDDAFCREHHCDKTQLVLQMKLGTEVALSKANFLRTTRFETLQGFVMYLLPLCRDEVSRGHSVLVGAAIRMAECMGLHRDGSAYGLSPLEIQVRRLVWHQLCFLDIRTCEAQGPRPAIRREDYDTLMPLNCKEADLTPQTAVWPDAAGTWTSALLSIMRFEINEMMRNIWTDRRKLELRKTTLTAMLTKVENFRKRMLGRYDRLLDESVPIQKYARLVMQLLIFRLHVMVLHPYHANAANPLPEKLNGLLVTSGVLIIEIAIRLETNPLFRDWTWYLGAYQQYQIALLLATEVYYRPAHREAERIWPCLDWVFHLDPNAPRETKILQILTEVASKTSVYMGLRKVRAPTTISRAVPDRQAVKGSPPAPTAEPLPRPGQTQRAPQQQHRQRRQQPLSALQPGPGVMSGIKTEHAISPLPIPPALSPGARPSLTPLNEFIPSHFAQPSVEMGTTVMMQPPHLCTSAPQQQQEQERFVPQHPLGFTPQPSAQPLYQHAVFSGVADGEALWSLPPRHTAPGSPDNSSDGGSMDGQAHHHHGGMAAATRPGTAVGIGIGIGAGAGAGAGAGVLGGQQQQQQQQHQQHQQQEQAGAMGLMQELDWVSFYLCLVVSGLGPALKVSGPAQRVPPIPATLLFSLFSGRLRFAISKKACFTLTNGSA
ncbi:hypothetical protein VTJ83DRAFT_575 [Remersonia thermophila]|uniref:Zn(2)-C6 fungal-type domain-containing protein n=1 Tax=Remersonia thermophila TaxID=72144 RepID=A0ABR4DM53_9PEZI